MSNCTTTITPIPTPTLVDSKPTAFVRRLIQKFAPVSNARVRYDTEKSLWCLLDSENKPLRHFAFGYIENAVFSFAEIKKLVHVAGCGGGYDREDTTTIGIATGTLREGVYHPSVRGLENLRFRGDSFLNGRDEVLRSASVLQLMPNRRALYRA